MARMAKAAQQPANLGDLGQKPLSIARVVRIGFEAMVLFRAVAMMVLAAVANPLCCCFAGPVSAGNASGVADEGSAAADHACCAAPQGAENPSRGSGDAHEDCRHLQERDAQISQAGESAVVSSPLLGSSFGVAYNATPSKATDAASDCWLSRERLGGDAFATPLERARVYCVFLL